MASPQSAAYSENRRWRARGALIAAGLMLLGAAPAAAIDSYARLPDDDSNAPPTPLSAELKGSENFNYDSNPLGLPRGAKELYGSVTSPELIILDSTPTSHVNFDTQVNENLYNLSNFDSTDVHETLRFNQQLSEWSFGLQNRFDYDTTRTSELTNFGLNLANVQHIGASVSPSIGYNWSSTDRLNVSGSAQISDYDNRAFVDYQVVGVTPSYSHDFDPNNTGTLFFAAQRYQTRSGGSQTTDTFGPTLGWTTTLSPTLKIALQAGAQESQQSGSINSSENDSWNYVFQADLSYTGQQDTTHFIASRAQYPFANGVETLLDAVTLTEIHNLNPKFALNLNGSYQFAEETPPSGVNLDYSASGMVGLTYHVFEHLDVTSSYQYNQQSLTNVSGTIRESVVLLGISYHPAMKAL